MDHGALLRMEWFVRTWLASAGTPGPARVLDVGSCDVNGCYRPLFDPRRFRYTGLDVAPGPNVDLVPSRPYRWPEIPDAAYDVVVSGQAFEHMEFFWKIQEEIARVLRPGGLLFLSLPRGYGRHRYPVDCWRFEADGMVALARYAGLVPLHASTHRAPPGHEAAWLGAKGAAGALSMLVARKPEGWSGLPGLDHYRCEPPDLEALATGLAEAPERGLWRRWRRATRPWRRRLQATFRRLAGRRPPAPMPPPEGSAP